MKLRKFRSVYLSLMIVMIVSMLGGCSPSTTPTAEVSKSADTPSGTTAMPSGITTTDTPIREVKDALVVDLGLEPPNMDPALGNNIGNIEICPYIFDRLFNLEPDGSFSNGLVDTYQLVDDKTLKIKLKPNIKFSDGTPLTADDVLWNIQHGFDTVTSKSQYLYVDFANSKVEDDLNLTIKFNQVWEPWMDTMASSRGSIMSRKAFEAMGADKGLRNPIGTGPYKISEWVSGSHITLVPNEYYWGTKPRMKQVIINFVASSSARVIELETGSADFAYSIDGSDLARVEALPGYQIKQGPSPLYYLLTLSMTEPLFQNVDVRTAMWEAIDKQAMVSSCTSGIGIPLSSFAPAVDKIKSFPEIPYNVADAKALLAKAGYPNGFEIDLFFVTDPVFACLGETIQGMWSEIGIKANIVNSSLATYAAQKNGHFQAAIRTGLAMDISNVWIIYETAFGYHLNPNDEWLNTQLLDLRHLYTTDPKRAETINAIADHLYEIRFSYPVMEMPFIYVESNKMEGFVFNGNPIGLNVADWVVYK